MELTVKVLVLGATGSGKSSSICQIPEHEITGLNPETTFIVACKKKELPVRGWLRSYQSVPEGAPPNTGNYKQTNQAALIANTINHVSTMRNDIKTIVLDDANYIMQDKFMNNTSTGYKIFSDIGNDMALVLRAIENSSKNIVLFMHHEAVDEGFQITYKAKTVGKMVDNYLTIEGMFSNVLFAKQISDPSTRQVQKVFVTNYDGQFPAKTPVGAFPDTYIKNDIGYVLDTLITYYRGDDELPRQPVINTNQATPQT